MKIAESIRALVDEYECDEACSEFILKDGEIPNQKVHSAKLKKLILAHNILEDGIRPRYKFSIVDSFFRLTTDVLCCGCYSEVVWWR